MHLPEVQELNPYKNSPYQNHLWRKLCLRWRRKLTLELVQKTRADHGPILSHFTWYQKPRAR